MFTTQYSSEPETRCLTIKPFGRIPHISTESKVSSDDKVCKDIRKLDIAAFGTCKPYRIMVFDKLDGVNVSVFKTEEGKLIPLTRSGYRAIASQYLHHHLFANYLYKNYEYFDSILKPNQWIVMEWCVQAIGTKYTFECPPLFFLGLFEYNEDETKAVEIDYFTFYTKDRPFEWNADVISMPIIWHRELNKGITPRDLDNYREKNETLDDRGYHRYSRKLHYTSVTNEGYVWHIKEESSNSKKDPEVFRLKYVRPSHDTGIYLSYCVWNKGVEPYLDDASLALMKSYEYTP